MNEVLLRRLVGAGVLFTAAFVAVWLLQGPLAPDTSGNPKAVRYDLRAPAAAPSEGKPPKSEVPPPGSTLEPATSGDVKTVPLAEAQKATAPGTPAPAPPAARESVPAIAAKPKEPAREAPKAVSAPAKPAAKAEGKPSSTAPKTVSKSAPKAPASKPAAKSADSGKPKADTAKASSPPGWYVQAGSFSDETNARSAMQTLYGMGLQPALQSVQVDKTLWYRIRVGPYKAQADAQPTLKRVVQMGFKGAKVTKDEGTKP